MEICERGFGAQLFPCILTDWPLGGYGYGERYIKGTSVFGPGPDGRKKLLYGGDRERAHVAALVRKVGRPLGPRMCSLHHCDNRACIAPEHLYEGTQAQNVQDMHDRKRALSPFIPGHAYGANLKVLTEAQKAEICSRYATGLISQVSLAAEFGVSQAVISRTTIKGGLRGSDHSPIGRAPERSEAEEREIADRYAAGGVSQNQLAAELGVTQGTVSRIIRRARKARQGTSQIAARAHLVHHSATVIPQLE